jgi:hypothetical protein
MQVVILARAVKKIDGEAAVGRLGKYVGLMGHQFVRVGGWRIGLREGCGGPKEQESEAFKEPDEGSHQASSNGWVPAGERQ